MFVMQTSNPFIERTLNIANTAVHPLAHQLSENREHLLYAAATFLQEVIQESGVLRIALIGSILTAKKNPKDIDFLLSVEDGLDLERLARAGRRLKGRAQEVNILWILFGRKYRSDQGNS